jgi:hypothetical protein
MPTESSIIVPSPFDTFPAFAKEIYAQSSKLPSTPFLWPALYGGKGEPGHEYKALFVFEKALPRDNLWRKKWGNSPCGCATDAIRTHRWIFLDWAFKNAHTASLFKLFGVSGPTDTFYEQFYITDLWKDHNPEHRPYWKDTLKIEFQCVRTQCVILVGTPAKNNGTQILKRLQDPPFYCTIRFPKNDQEFRDDLNTLKDTLIRRHIIQNGGG